MPDLSATTELLRLLGGPTRVRLLALLGREELTVAEITDVTQLAQSRVSTHLGKLREAGLVKDRRDGAEGAPPPETPDQSGCSAAAASTAKKPRRRAQP